MEDRLWPASLPGTMMASILKAQSLMPYEMYYHVSAVSKYCSNRTQATSTAQIPSVRVHACAYRTP